jgi:hypothetical protein
MGNELIYQIKNTGITNKILIFENIKEFYSTEVKRFRDLEGHTGRKAREENKLGTTALEQVFAAYSPRIIFFWL